MVKSEWGLARWLGVIRRLHERNDNLHMIPRASIKIHKAPQLILVCTGAYTHSPYAHTVTMTKSFISEWITREDFFFKRLSDFSDSFHLLKGTRFYSMVPSSSLWIFYFVCKVCSKVECKSIVLVKVRNISNTTWPFLMTQSHHEEHTWLGTWCPACWELSGDILLESVLLSLLSILLSLPLSFLPSLLPLLLLPLLSASSLLPSCHSLLLENGIGILFSLVIYINCTY